MTTPTTDVAGAAESWIPDDSTFGMRLAMVRQKMGWGNVAEAARECGLERASWRLWEQDGREPRNLVTICMAIASRARVDVDWLIRGRKLTGGYPRDLADLVNPRIPTALHARVVAPVRHGDGRRRPNSGRTIPRQTRSRATAGQTSRPVSRSPVT